MFGKLLGDIASTVVRTANLPAEALDRTVDWALDEDEDDSALRVSEPGRGAADSLRELLETLDG